MKTFYYKLLFLSLFLAYSCANKEVQLPKIEIDGIPEIHNHSSIWIFYEKKGNDEIAVLNKNNKILNTHWIFNIDRRLPMKEVIPILIQMQKNKNKDSMHKKEGMFNYFSYADLESNKISLVDFNQTLFISTKNEYQTFLNEFENHRIIELDVQNEDLFLNRKRIELNQLQERIEQLKSKDSINSIKLLLKYDENTSYQNYLSAKAFLSKVEIQIDSTEYIYSLK